MSMSGLIPFGAFFPIRNSFARPAVGTRSSTRNDAALWVVIPTEDDPLGIVSSKKTWLFASATAGTRSAIEATARRTRTPTW